MSGPLVVTSEPLSPGIPVALQIEVTSNCNLRCRMCPLTSGTSSSGISPGDISDATWSQLLPLARRARQVFVSGFGEPFTSLRCLDLLHQLDNEAIRTTLVTNGVALSAKIASVLASMDHLVHINVSIDSPDPGIYRAIRGGSFQRAWRGLANLLEVVDASRVTVSSVAMQANLESLADFPALLATLGVRTYILQGLVDYNAYSGEQRLDGPGDLSAQVARLRSACDSHGVELVLTTPQRTGAELAEPDLAAQRYFRRPGEQDADTRQCMIPWEIPYIDKDGKVFPCCYAGAESQSQLGDVGTTPLADIWVGAAFQEFRHALLSGDTTPPICRSCTLVPIGQHPLRAFRASLVESSLNISSTGRVTVQYQNAGTRTWTAGDAIYIGTATPRDAPSPLAHPSWLSPARACSFSQDQVAPGQVATFTFLTGAQEGAVSQQFQLVAEGVCWIPDTQFTVSGGRDALVAARALLRWYRRYRQKRSYRAALESADLTLREGDGIVTVKVRNSGTATWTAADRVHIGTSRPLDGASPLVHPSWLGDNRTCSFLEEAVRPGETATFRFAVGRAVEHHSQSFQLVVEKLHWLPGTELTISASGVEALAAER